MNGYPRIGSESLFSCDICPAGPGGGHQRGCAAALRGDRPEAARPARALAATSVERRLEESMETLITRMEDTRRATPDVYGVEAAGVVVSFRHQPVSLRAA